MTGVRAMVFRELYRGQIVYGKTRWADKGDTKVKRDCPEAEWLTLDAPALALRAGGSVAGRARASTPDAANLPPADRRQAVRPPESGIEARHFRSERAALPRAVSAAAQSTPFVVPAAAVSPGRLRL
jgi:hypothetical protein